ncbi:peptidase dimerization domain-containing protein, partial [Myxococcota bacterium]|nr:peptidase dimerization domain-containing protein [Myxococcota bacterium]
AVITFSGIGVHPGYAKGKMVSALKMAAAFIAKLPPDGVSPETTEGREGFVHPHDIRGNEETTTVKFLLRDFDVSNLDRQMHLLEGLATEVKAHYPNGDIKIERKAWYRNMKEMLDLRPEVTELAKEAVVRAGLEPISKPIRGGTDGARLSFMGLPTPNIFTGGHNFHSRREWIALQHMAKASETCLHIIDLWLEKGEKKGLLPKA